MFDPETIQGVAQATGLGGVGVLALCLIGWLTFKFFVKIDAPAPTRKTVDWAVKCFGWGAILSLVLSIASYSVIQLAALFAPEKRQAVGVYLNDVHGRRVESRGFDLTYYLDAAEGAHEKVVQGTGSQAILLDVPRHARSVHVIAFDDADYEIAGSYDDESSRWAYPIKDGRVDVSVVRRDYPPQLPTVSELRDFIRTNSLDEEQIAHAGSNEIPENVMVTIRNDTDLPVRAIVFNCRHIQEASPPDYVVSEDPEFLAVTSDDRCVVYSKFRETETIESNRELILTQDDFEQFWEPNGWFAIAVRYQLSTERKKRQEIAGVFQMFSGPNPIITIERALSDDPNHNVVARLK